MAFPIVLIVLSSYRHKKTFLFTNFRLLFTNYYFFSYICALF